MTTDGCNMINQGPRVPARSSSLMMIFRLFGVVDVILVTPLRMSSCSSCAMYMLHVPYSAAVCFHLYSCLACTSTEVREYQLIDRTIDENAFASLAWGEREH